MGAAPDQQKSASRRRLHAWPPARCARGKRSRRMHAHKQRRAHALLCRRVRASACRTARAAAHASPSAQGRPGSSMISPEAVNGAGTTEVPALAMFGTSARGAATHVVQRRCGEWGTRIPASWHRAHPRTASSRQFTRFVLWARRGAHRSSAGTHRREAALTAGSPRSSQRHATVCARAAQTTSDVRQRAAGAAHGGTAGTARKLQLLSERTSGGAW